MLTSTTRIAPTCHTLSLPDALPISRLEALTPDIPVLSEESADTIPTSVRRSWSRLWVVDPLDGTREFGKRNGKFTVNIALVEDGEVLFGVIQAPVTGALWPGARGQGAFRRDGEHDSPTRTRADEHTSELQ